MADCATLPAPTRTDAWPSGQGLRPDAPTSLQATTAHSQPPTQLQEVSGEGGGGLSGDGHGRVCSGVSMTRGSSIQGHGFIARLRARAVGMTHSYLHLLLLLCGGKASFLRHADPSCHRCAVLPL